MAVHNPDEAVPRLAAVVATDRFATIEDLVHSLAAQGRAAELELVVVCPSAAGLGPAPEPARALGAVRVVERPLLPLGEARATGVRRAEARVVVVAETHAFPDPNWADALIRSHDAGWGAVMPGVWNANPATALSWAGFLVDYGRWAATGSGHEIDDLPSYHASFKREELLAFGPELGRLLEPGSGLGAELRKRGALGWHEPRATVGHLNVARPRAWAHERFLGGRLLGAERRARWSRARVLVYLAGSPLVPLVRLWRTRPAFTAAAAAGVLPRWSRIATVAGCVAWGVGEAVGYAAGAGRSAARMLEYELHKQRYL